MYKLQLFKSTHEVAFKRNYFNIMQGSPVTNFCSMSELFKYGSSQFQISPLVDDGWFCTAEVEQSIHDLISSNTEFDHLTKAKVFQVRWEHSPPMSAACLNVFYLAC